ncbi:Glycoside hydrolase family 17 [Dillenia turbinata]|uniref:glucan endo-1,3-beta-D-glucosidase n=1 Tax=Dillenia turbinata TaxID=194707 RepID=A0AAN8Z8V5_9MAGN
MYQMAAVIMLLFFSVLVSLSSTNRADIVTTLGVNYGELGDNLPMQTESVKLIQKLKANWVKLYSANPQILKALQGTNIPVSIMVPNQLISSISSNQTLTDQWVGSNLLPFYPKTKIRHLLVGNEVLSSWVLREDKLIGQNLVPAMRRIKASLKSYKIRNVKVGTPLAVDVLNPTLQPSKAYFRADVAGRIMKQLLEFIESTKSFFFIDAYPFFTWSNNNRTISLDYALFEGGVHQTYKDPKTGLVYTNLLDQMLDSLYFAMKRLGYPNIRTWICETGWPNGGDIDQIGANVYNAATYNRNLVKKLHAKPPVGTPAQPGMIFPTFIFALYNENQKGGPGTERHWGLLYPNGSNVYPVDLSGKTPETVYGPLPKPQNNKPYKGKIWCVVAKGANLTELPSALKEVCMHGNRLCDPIRPGRECYKPVSIVQHASYAFSSYWAQFRGNGGYCFFNGLAVQTTKDPSK